MSIDYSQAAINARLQAVVSTIDIGGNGYLILLAGATAISTIQLANPCGTVNGGILTFGGTLLDPSAAATGVVDGAKITDSTGAVVISGLTVGVPPSSGYDILISNGLNSTLITAGQSVSATGQIVGS